MKRNNDFPQREKCCRATWKGFMMVEKKKTGFVDRFLTKIEVAGNKLPDPILIFIILMGIILRARL